MFEQIGIVLAFAAINRIRGGGYLPIDGKYAMTPVVMLLAYALGIPSIFHFTQYFPYQIIRVSDAVLFGACWLAWATPAWGEWMAVGYAPTVPVNNWFNKLIDSLGLGAAGSFFVRMFIGLI